MSPGQMEYIGDGLYVYFDGQGFELRANDHEEPTDRVYLERPVAFCLIDLINKTLKKSSE